MPATLRITDAASEPVTLAEAKLQCKVDGDAFDASLTALIVSARKAAEHQLQRSLINTTWERVEDRFPCGRSGGAGAIPLFMPKVQSVSYVRYIDDAGVERTLDPEDYLVDADSSPGWVVPAYNTTWPTTREQVNAVRVRYVAGYGAAAASVPSNIKAWMLAHIAHFHRHAEASVMGVIQPLPYLDHLLDAERVWVY